MESEAKAAQERAIAQELASFSPESLTDEEFDRLSARMGLPPLPMPPSRPVRSDLADLNAPFDVPIAVGKRR